MLARKPLLFNGPVLGEGYSKMEFIHKGRMYVVANRAYLLEAVTPRFDEETKDVDRFLASFRLTGEN